MVLRILGVTSAVHPRLGPQKLLSPPHQAAGINYLIANPIAWAEGICRNSEPRLNTDLLLKKNKLV